jgi:hypothetical protein
MPRHGPLPLRALERSSALKGPKHRNTVNNTAAFWLINSGLDSCIILSNFWHFYPRFSHSDFRPVFRHLHRAPRSLLVCFKCSFAGLLNPWRRPSRSSVAPGWAHDDPSMSPGLLQFCRWCSARPRRMRVIMKTAVTVRHPCHRGWCQ